MKKEKIYTIPVIDAFNEDCECPICFLFEKLERDTINYVLGTAYMEADFRKQTNDLGFCREHYAKLYAGQNVLGLTLIVQSRMMKLREELDNLATSTPTTKRNKLFSNNVNKSKLGIYIEENKESCYICNKVDEILDNYLDTFFYLWKTESSFKELVKSSKGFCLPHFGTLYDMASQKLMPTQAKEFLDLIISLQKNNLDRVLKDVQWFVNKYDYRYENEPWKNAKDAPKRSIKKVIGLNVDK